jgi:hypothetical protein
VSVIRGQFSVFCSLFFSLRPLRLCGEYFFFRFSRPSIFLFCFRGNLFSVTINYYQSLLITVLAVFPSFVVILLFSVLSAFFSVFSYEFNLCAFFVFIFFITLCTLCLIFFSLLSLLCVLCDSAVNISFSG